MKHLQVSIKRTQISYVFIAVADNTDESLIERGLLYHDKIKEVATEQLKESDWLDDGFKVEMIERIRNANDMEQCEYVGK